MRRAQRLAGHLAAAPAGRRPAPLGGAFMGELRAACAEVTVDPRELERHGVERSGHAAPGLPQAVAYPTSAAEVQAVVRACAARGVPVVPYAGGTSLEGHTVAVRGGVTLSFARMARLLRVSADDMDCTVEPGLGWVALNRELAPHGLFLGVDPSPAACVGGMCATRCSGTKALMYGTMAQQVLSMEVVLADGTLVRTGRRARKSSAGYDLARLFVGSEGTLGVVVSVTLRLRRVPERTAVARVGFRSVGDAAAAVARVVAAGVPLAAAELLDDEMVRAVNAKYARRLGGALPETTTVLFKFAGSPRSVDLDVERARELCGPAAAGEFVFSRTDREADMLWMARKLALWAAKAQRPGRRLLTTDVCVPISRLAAVIGEIKAELSRSPLYAPIVAHAGDGNLHAFVMLDDKSEAERAEAGRLSDFMVRLAIENDGTCTGEHGVGSGKRKYLEAELGPEAVALMRRIKTALDPAGILNPGKVLL